MILTLADILKNHIIDGEFVRSDIFVRYLAIQRYYGENDFGIRFYNTMQKHKKGFKFNKKKNQCGFVYLIRSFEEHGYIDTEENYLPLNDDGRLSGGSHRLACCLYFGIREIPCILGAGGNHDTIMTLDWFKKRKFKADKISHLIKTQKEILHNELGI